MKVRVETIHQYCSEKQRIAKKCDEKNPGDVK
jgi:hypothetical protein